MALAAQLDQSTALTPRERERAKTAQQRAEDAIYTLNHTLTCMLVTDPVVIPLLRLAGFNVGHSHDKKAPPAEPVAAPKPVQVTPTRIRLSPPTPAIATQDKPKQGLFTGLIQKKPAAVGESYQVLQADCREPGCSHDHFTAEKTTQRAAQQPASGGSSHAGHTHPPLGATPGQKAWHWMVTEAIGDIGAAALTIPTQRYFPGVMDAMRRGLEPMVGGFFHRGAERAARTWADKHGLDYNNQEVVQHAEKLYHYEMQHLPQMAVWTGSSILLHYGAIKYLEPTIGIGEFAGLKAVGAGITAATVVGVRALAPDKAHAWDQTAGKHVVVPITKTVGKLFGVKESDVDAYHSKHTDEGETPKTWANRVQEPNVPAVNTLAV